MAHDPVDDEVLIDRLLATPGHWAVVGLSTDPARPAHGVSAYLQQIGHTITPVHPAAPLVHGMAGVTRLSEIPGPVDVVDLFIASARVGAVVDEAIAIGARAVWFQLGVHDAAAEDRARAAGLDVVVDRCPAIEGRRRDLG
ncbi:MAG: CoA-binding protein [Actinobacteria bacterium]|nr:CoA-binding protein [Actinomycetota bacterium]MCG2801698.1 CoA-binding protein [Cellulomonas sp.]